MFFGNPGNDGRLPGLSCCNAGLGVAGEAWMIKSRFPLLAVWFNTAPLMHLCNVGC